MAKAAIALVVLLPPVLATAATEQCDADGTCAAVPEEAAESLIQKSPQRVPLQKQASLLEDTEQGQGIPEKCLEFFEEDCGLMGVSATFQGLEDYQGAFKQCCADGGHGEAVCTSLTSEIFKKHEGPVSDALCTEMVDLFEAHKAWVSDRMVSRTAGDETLALLDKATENKLFGRKRPRPRPRPRGRNTPSPTPFPTRTPTRRPTRSPTRSPTPSPTSGGSTGGTTGGTSGTGSCGAAQGWNCPLTGPNWFDEWVEIVRALPGTCGQCISQAEGWFANFNRPMSSMAAAAQQMIEQCLNRKSECPVPDTGATARACKAYIDKANEQVAKTGPNPPCNICRDGEYPGNTGMVINFLYIGQGSCAQYWKWGKQGNIQNHMCDPVKYFAHEPCGCGEFNENKHCLEGWVPPN